MGYYAWPKYVPVAERRALAAERVQSRKKSGQVCNPVVIEGRTIAKTFWGKAWCDHLEAYSDYETRLPRGRTYVRNGSVIDLQIVKGKVEAEVMGSSLYRISIEIKPIQDTKWQSLIKACSGKIESLIELLQGTFSKGVMEIITQKESGLFPKPSEISMRCSCPDYADMCKHVAAVLYGVGAILDKQPESLFVLRTVDHMELLAAATSSTLAEPSLSDTALDESQLAELFGIELEQKPKRGRKKKSDAPT